MSKSITFDDFLTEVREHQSGKACYKCNEHKPLSEFYKDKWTKDGKTHKCKSCAKKYEANICRFRKWFTDKKKNAKHAGTEFIIQPEDIPGVMASITSIFAKKNIGIESIVQKEDLKEKTVPIVLITDLFLESNHIELLDNILKLDSVNSVRSIRIES